MATNAPVLVGLDGSSTAATAFAVAAREATTRSVPLLVVHSWLVTEPGLPLAPRALLDDQTQGRLEEALADHVAELIGGGPAPEIELRVVYGYAGRVLAELSQEACLVVVGARGLGVLRRALLGSVSQHVLEHASCPVMVVHPDAQTPRRVVVGVDGSPPSLHALRWAAARARRDDLPLVVVHASGPAHTPLFPGPALVLAGRDRRQAAEQRLDGWVREVLGSERVVLVDRVCAAGHAASLLLESTGPDDVVFVGHRGADGHGRLRLGSVARRVATHARATVVVVPHRQVPQPASGEPAVAPRDVRAPTGVGRYPSEYERDVVLTDGRVVHVRPVVPEDVTGLAEAVERADPETIRRRFLGGSPPRSVSGLQRLVSVDYVTRFAMAAFAPDGTGVGIARYEGESTWPAVDIAVVVHPDWRSVGLARELLADVVRRAAEQGATRLMADFFADNVRVQDLLTEAGLPERRQVDHGVVQDVISLNGIASA